MSDTPTWGSTPQPQPTGDQQPAGQAPSPLGGGWGQDGFLRGALSQGAGDAPGWQPGATASPDDPVAAHDILSAVPAPAATRGRRPHARAWLAVASAVVLAVAGTSTSVVLAGTGGGGAGSPAAAVQDLVNALNKSDVIGMLDALDPGERSALEPGLEDIFGQLKRLGVMSSTADLNAITGVDISEQGLSISTDQLTPNVAAVTVSGGSNTEGLDPSQLPLGSYFQHLADQAMNSRSVTTSGPNRGSTTLGTVRVDGGWYVSLGYSIAIDALRASGGSGAPPATGPLQATGASSPEGAVQALFNDASQFDLSGLLADLDPGEMAALDAYAPDWLPNAQAALDKARGEVSIQFGNLNLTTEPVDGGTLVTLGEGLTVTVKTQRTVLVYANGCYTFSAGGTTTHRCAEDSAQLAQLKGFLPQAVQPIFARLTTMKPDIGFVTVNDGGQWYVSPTRTYLEAVSAFLAELRPGDIQAVVNNASGIGSGFEKYLQQQMRTALPGDQQAIGSLSSSF